MGAWVQSNFIDKHLKGARMLRIRGAACGAGRRAEAVKPISLNWLARLEQAHGVSYAA